MINLFQILSELKKRKEISLQELEFARFLNRVESSDPKEILFMGMACIRHQMDGHLCISITEFLNHPVYAKLIDKSLSDVQILDLIVKSGLIGTPGDSKPLILDDGKVYLQKIWKYEKELIDWLLKKADENDILAKENVQFVNQIFGGSADVDWQRIAVKVALLKNLVIISGGPGTGKTFTIKRIIEALKYSNSDKKIKIALAAPTGKAAQRLNDSLVSDDEELEVGAAVTIHKLLGAEFGSSTYKYNKANQLVYDVVVVDEASMLDIHLWTALIRSLPDTAKLILLGDKDQLSSVEAGSILGDICSGATNSFSMKVASEIGEPLLSNKSFPLNDCFILLEKTYRVEEGSGIKILSDAVNSGDFEKVLEILKSDQFPYVTLKDSSKKDIDELISKYVLKPGQNNRSIEDMRSELNTYKILCALRRGPFGIEEINRASEKALKGLMGIPVNQQWYSGRTIMINRSNNQFKLRNGETGLCIQANEGEFEILFDRKEEFKLSTTRLQDYELAYANTIHKSQGSEYDHVAILLPNEANPLLSRELLYTAITRAKKSIVIYAKEEIVVDAVKKVVSRNSGIKTKIWTETLNLPS